MCGARHADRGLSVGELLAGGSNSTYIFRYMYHEIPKDPKAFGNSSCVFWEIETDGD